jgi:hypothetical protein
MGVGVKRGKGSAENDRRAVVGLRRLHDFGDDRRHAVPLFAFRLQLFAARSREGIVLRPAIVLGDLPLGFDPAFFLHAVERRVKRTFVDLKSATRELLEFLRDAPTVQFAAAQNAEDKHVERTLWQITFVAHALFT